MASSAVRGIPRTLGPGRPGDPGLFGPRSVAWRVNGEAALILGGPRALLMQIAQPEVAAAVAEHSGFPQDAYARLWRTMDVMLRLSFGDSAQAREAASQVNAVHTRVSGRTESGAEYRALRPDLLLWVHATLVDTALLAYRRFVGRLPPGEEERYYQEMKRLARAMRVPAGILPRDLGAFRRYLGKTVAGLEVTAAARRLAPAIISPPLPLAARPAGTWLRAVTVDLLPPTLREQYGLSWGPARKAATTTSELALRSLLRVLPGAPRRAPHARAAELRVRSGADSERT